MKPVFLVLISSLCFGCATSDYCNVMGDLSGVVCVTETQYKFVDFDELLPCPTGTWCANQREICVREGVPACRFLKDCHSCGSKSPNTCVTETQFVKCVNGEPDTEVIDCPESKMFCSMEYDVDIPRVVCTNWFQNTCETYSTTTTTMEPGPTVPEFECTGLGKFPDKSDPTCKRYFYCFTDQNSNGDDVINSMVLACPGDSVYDPLTSKCVVSANFVCNNV